MTGLRLYGVVGVGALLLGLIVALFVLSSRIETRTIERDNARAETKAEKAAHAQTVANYRAAAEVARQEADRNVARVKAEQAAVTKGTVDDYQKRLDAVDARYERVRAQLAARTDFSSPDLAPVSVASDATCRAYGGTDCDGLLAKLAIAERQAENLVALRAWVRGQANVVVTPELVAERR